MCAAPVGNQFWKLRSKHGRDKLFETPELLLQACEEYFNWVDAHPWYKVEQLKKAYQEDAIDKQGKATKRWVTVTKVPTARPYTIEGLCRYLRCNTLWFRQFEASLKGKDDELSKDFSSVCSHVREVIYQQKFEGAAVGAFSPSIIQRDLGLRDNQDVKISNPDGESFKTENTHKHEVIFRKMSGHENKESDQSDVQ